MGIRANAPHFWAWSNQIQSQLPKGLLAMGVVAGDAHILNFGDLKLKDQIRFGLVDLDDAGRGLFFFDYLRLNIANRAGFVRVADQELLSAYMKGLKKEKIEKPDHIDDALDMSEKEFDKRQQKYWDKNTSDGKFKYEKLGLRPMSEMSAEMKANWKEIKIHFEKEFPNREILDVAFKIKTTGGSQGMVRFWVLTEKNGDVAVFEFKEMSEPAVSEISKQLTHENRIQEIRDIYWKGDQSKKFQVVKTKAKTFWMRPRYKNSLSAKLPDGSDMEERDQAREELIYIANYLGRMHAKQGDVSAYLRALNTQSSLITELTAEYLAKAKELNK